VLVACWSAKGGAGTTVVSVALALRFARSSSLGALVVDLGGDVPAACGLAEPDGPGLAGWLDAGPDVPADSLSRLEVDLAPGLSLLPRGVGPLAAGRAEVLAAVLADDPRPVVVDCGAAPEGAALALAAGATHSLLVTRPCFLALRRAVHAPIRASGVILVTEPGRALDRGDVEEVLGIPVRAEIALDPAVARAVDAGLLAGRLPRTLDRGLRWAA
jgi:hypothetical protein